MNQYFVSRLSIMLPSICRQSQFAPVEGKAKSQLARRQAIDPVCRVTQTIARPIWLLLAATELARKLVGQSIATANSAHTKLPFPLNWATIFHFPSNCFSKRNSPSESRPKFIGRPLVFHLTRLDLTWWWAHNLTPSAAAELGSSNFFLTNDD